MANEQRKAIYRLDKDKDCPLACGDITIVNIADIDTALLLIQEQQEEIEGLKNKEVLIKRYFKKCDLIKQKDKQIDLMADFMYKTGTGRRAFSCAFRQNDECDENGCRHCIKQYFENKVNSEKEK